MQRIPYPLRIHGRMVYLPTCNGRMCYGFHVGNIYQSHGFIRVSVSILPCTCRTFVYESWMVFFPNERPLTPLKTNMSPENQWLEDVFPIEMVPFWGTC